jgi:hypothetical protein
MRKGRYEQELDSLEMELKNIPRLLTKIKARGRKLESAKNSLRKASARFELCRRDCLSLPKSWELYRAHGRYRNLYDNPKVQAIHNAMGKLEWADKHLAGAVEYYNKRLADRKELKSRLKSLPDEIESAKILYDIESKRKKERELKVKPPKNWRDIWQEVADGLFIPAKTLKAYLKTFQKPIELTEENVTIKDKWFILKPSPYKRDYLKLNCYTFDQVRFRT